MTLRNLLDMLTHPLEIGGLRLTVLSSLVGIALFVALLLAVRLVRHVLRDRVLTRAGLNLGVRTAISTLAGYSLLLLGLLIILPVMLPGFNLTTLSLVLGAVSFGVGFGLRNVADNFVSGLILLIERPIKVGDRIQVGDLEGQVVEVRARSTTVRTNDNIDIIVPNAEFVASRVTNLSHNDNLIRFRIPVGVHYQSDVSEVEAALLAAAAACPDVLTQPEPQVRFMGFGDSALNFELRAWSETLYNRPNKLRSQVNYLIWEEFTRRGIKIPYPQRDLYVKEWPGPAPPTASTASCGQVIAPP